MSVFIYRDRQETRESDTIFIKHKHAKIFRLGHLFSFLPVSFIHFISPSSNILSFFPSLRSWHPPFFLPPCPIFSPIPLFVNYPPFFFLPVFFQFLFPYFFLAVFVHPNELLTVLQISLILLLLNVFFSSEGAKPASAGEVPADPDHLIEDGEEGEEADPTETISKEEAAERLLVGSEFGPPDTRLLEQTVTLMWPLCCRRRRRSSRS